MEEELEITLSKELKYIELIDSTQNDIKALKTQVNDLIDNNIALSRANNKNISRLTRSRKISLGLTCVSCYPSNTVILMVFLTII